MRVGSNDININSYNQLFSNLQIGNILNKQEAKKLITKINYEHPFFKGVFKINIVGSTGAGKTAFMKRVLGELFQIQSDVKRRAKTENKVDSSHTWFRIGTKKSEEKQSTTTLSLNSAGILLVRTLFNSIEFHSPKQVDDLLLRDDIEEIYKLNFFDNAGQERFDL